MAQLKSSLGAILFAAGTCSLLIAPPGLQAQTGQWRNLGLPDLNVTSITASSLNLATIYVAASGGLFKSTDRGDTWRNLGTEQFECGSASSVFSDPKHPGVLFASSACLGTFPFFSLIGGLYKSADAGASWNLVLSNGFFVRFSPGDQSIACAGADNFQYGHPSIYSGFVSRTTDDGDTWSDSLMPETAHPISEIAFAPSDPSTVYGGFADSPFGGNGIGVFKSTDAGQSWAALPDVGLLTNTTISLAVDPTDPDIVLAVVNTLGSQLSARGIFRTTDGGATWSQSDTGLGGVHAELILYDAHDPARAYSATTGGVFRSTDGGLTWLPMNTGLASVTLNTLSFDSTGTILYAGTSAGIYSFEPAAAFGCIPDSRTLCLDNGRFQVQAQWTDFHNNSGLASVVPGATSNNSGVMWFFSQDNWELLIKVLNGCGVNGRYWVFGAAATNVQYTIQVTDTQTGDIRTYTNPLGTTSPAITDTAAFPGCL